VHLGSKKIAQAPFLSTFVFSPNSSGFVKWELPNNPGVGKIKIGDFYFPLY